MADTWCEKRMWKSVGWDTQCEIVSVLSSLPFFVWPFYGVPSDIPNELVVMQCCMCHLGFGTLIFHSGLANPLNTMMDYYPMILTAILLMYIYGSHLFSLRAKFFCTRLLFDCKRSVFAWLMILTCWGLFLCYGLHEDFAVLMGQLFPGGRYFHWTNALNVIMVFPMVMIFLYYSVYYLPINYVYRAWTLLAISEAFYFINYLACQYSYWLGIFHGVSPMDVFLCLFFFSV